jgi:hypothetical protein
MTVHEEYTSPSNIRVITDPPPKAQHAFHVLDSRSVCPPCYDRGMPRVLTELLHERDPGRTPWRPVLVAELLDRYTVPEAVEPEQRPQPAWATAMERDNTHWAENMERLAETGDHQAIVVAAYDEDPDDDEPAPTLTMVWRRIWRKR